VQLIPRAAFDTIHREPGWEYTGMSGAPYGMRRQIVASPSGIPCTPPPFSTLLAVSLVTGRRLWEVPLGDARRALQLAGYPHADSVPPQTGTSVLGGPIVTAGGLVFIAGTRDNYLRAFDIESGAELWRGELPGRGKATPMTYRLAVDGRQYVVVAVGGEALVGKGATLVAFALPE
jgi:quinoprotein glucose dehydrogenase